MTMRTIQRIALKEDGGVIETDKQAKIIYFAYLSGFPYIWLDEINDRDKTKLEYCFVSGSVFIEINLDRTWQHAASTMTEGGRVRHLYVQHSQA